MHLALQLAAMETQALGRVEYTNIPQQSLMELMVADLLRPIPFEKPNGHFMPIDSWTGLAFTATGDVKSITWTNYGLNGTIYFQWTPPTVQKFAANDNRLRCTIDLSVLDRTRMVSLNAERNEIHGSIDLEHLPNTLEGLSLAVNQLTGSIVLNQLPDSLSILDLRINRLSGSVDLTRLPKKMTWLNLMSNEFEGTVQLHCLPPKMRNVYLNGNRFEGGLQLLNLPASLRWVDVGENKLSGNVEIDSSIAYAMKIELGANGKLQVVTGSGQKCIMKNIYIDA